MEITLVVSSILMLSLLVEMTIPMFPLVVLMRSSFLSPSRFSLAIASPK